jgi:hypothetical protein
MTKTTHTHRGTCQACGSVQAVDNVSGLLAKHGYQVIGYFSGTCQGSDRKPAEHDVAYTRTVIAFCTETAASHDAAVACLKDGSSVPKTFERWNPTKKVVHTPKHGAPYTVTGGNDKLPIAQATPAERTKAIALAIHNEELQASGLRSHADGLTRYVLVRFGSPLYVAAELDAPKVKPAAPTVDVATATVTGTYKTKAARKEALDRLSRQYDKARKVLQDAYLNGNRNAEGALDLYYAAYELHQWRPKHSAAARTLYPSLASTVAEIEALVKAREAVKAAP